MWSHFVNLVSRSWFSLVSAMGTTTLALVIGFIGFLFVLAINLLSKLRKDGWSWSVTMSHFSQNVRDSVVPTIIGTVVLWGVLFGSFVVKTVYYDHQDLVKANGILLTRNHSLVDPKSRDEEIKALKEQVEDLKKAKPAPTGLESKLRDAQEQISGLQARLALGSAAEPLKITATQNSLGAIPNEGKYQRQIIYLTNKTITPVSARITCQGEVRRIAATISGAGVVMGGARTTSKHDAELGIGAPAWTPTTPLLVFVYYDKPDLGACTLTQ